MILSSTIMRAGEDLRVAGSDSPRGDYGRLFGRSRHPTLRRWEPTVRGADPVETLWELAQGMYAEPVPDNDAIPAGYTYFGQLITHDLTFDASSSLEQRNVPAQIPNLRTPRFDLDCVYGRGPHDQPYLYDGDKLALGTNHRGELDLLRSPVVAGGKSSHSENPFNLRRAAIIGDARNDENLIISQLHLAVIRFHNRRIDQGDGFEDARRQTRWHYQWVAVHDFLRRLCGSTLVDDVLGTGGKPNLRFFDPSTQPYVPIEFSLAAYRVGHCMVRSGYTINAALRERGGPLPIFAGIAEDSLVGGRALPPSWTIQWSFFVAHPQHQADLQFSKSIGPHIAGPLKFLPMPRGETTRLRSLAFRTLLRGWRTGLPSGQSVAEVMKEPVIDGNDPLWIYVLKEAAQGGGRRLGPVGARIVAETFVGLLAADPQSYLAAEPGWTPARGPDFGLADFLAEAGAPITQPEWDRRPGA